VLAELLGEAEATVAQKVLLDVVRRQMTHDNIPRRIMRAEALQGNPVLH